MLHEAYDTLSSVSLTSEVLQEEAKSVTNVCILLEGKTIFEFSRQKDKAGEGIDIFCQLFSWAC